MKVKLYTTMAGPDGTHMAGSVVDMGDEQAQALIDGGYAVEVDAEGKPIEAEAAPAKTAKAPKAK